MRDPDDDENFIDQCAALFAVIFIAFLLVALGMCAGVPRG